MPQKYAADFGGGRNLGLTEMAFYKLVMLQDRTRQSEKAESVLCIKV